MKSSVELALYKRLIDLFIGAEMGAESGFHKPISFQVLITWFRKVTGRFGPIPVRTPGRFGPIPFRSGRFGPGRFGPIYEVGRFGPILVGRFGPLYSI